MAKGKLFVRGEENNYDDPNWVSRSEKRRNSGSYIELAKLLSELTPRQLAALKLPELIDTEIRQAIAHKVGSAKNRQVKFAAGVMRQHEDGPALLALHKEGNLLPK
jgi:ribosomal 50S subunit-associated protein YjgA (DUF615 family)